MALAGLKNQSKNKSAFIARSSVFALHVATFAIYVQGVQS